MPLQLKIFVFLIFLSMVPFTVGADEWGTLSSRESALDNLKDRNPLTRRAALARLADVGVDEDVPHMLRLLRDDEPAVRSMAHQAITGLWLRLDNLAAKRTSVKALTAIQDGDSEAAVELLDNVIEVEPEFSEAWKTRGDAWLNVGDLDKALADYEVALKLNPYHYGVMESCGSIWMERSEARLAYDYLSQAIAINPNLEYLIPVIVDLEQRLENDRI